MRALVVIFFLVVLAGCSTSKSAVAQEVMIDNSSITYRNFDAKKASLVHTVSVVNDSLSTVIRRDNR